MIDATRCKRVEKRTPAIDATRHKRVEKCTSMIGATRYARVEKCASMIDTMLWRLARYARIVKCTPMIGATRQARIAKLKCQRAMRSIGALNSKFISPQCMANKKKITREDAALSESPAERHWRQA